MSLYKGSQLLAGITNKTTTSFVLQKYSVQAWEVKGMAAQS